MGTTQSVDNERAEAAKVTEAFLLAFQSRYLAIYSTVNISRKYATGQLREQPRETNNNNNTGFRTKTIIRATSAPASPVPSSRGGGDYSNFESPVAAEHATSNNVQDDTITNNNNIQTRKRRATVIAPGEPLPGNINQDTRNANDSSPEASAAYLGKTFYSGAENNTKHKKSATTTSVLTSSNNFSANNSKIPQQQSSTSSVVTSANLLAGCPLDVGHHSVQLNLPFDARNWWIKKKTSDLSASSTGAGAGGGTGTTVIMNNNTSTSSNGKTKIHKARSLAVMKGNNDINNNGNDNGDDDENASNEFGTDAEDEQTAFLAKLPLSVCPEVFDLSISSNIAISHRHRGILLKLSDFMKQFNNRYIALQRDWKASLWEWEEHFRAGDQPRAKLDLSLYADGGVQRDATEAAEKRMQELTSLMKIKWDEAPECEIYPMRTVELFERRERTHITAMSSRGTSGGTGAVILQFGARNEYWRQWVQWLEQAAANCSPYVILDDAVHAHAFRYALDCAYDDVWRIYKPAATHIHGTNNKEPNNSGSSSPLHNNLNVNGPASENLKETNNNNAPSFTSTSTRFGNECEVPPFPRHGGGELRMLTTTLYHLLHATVFTKFVAHKAKEVAELNKKQKEALAIRERERELLLEKERKKIMLESAKKNLYDDDELDGEAAESIAHKNNLSGNALPSPTTLKAVNSISHDNMAQIVLENNISTNKNTITPSTSTPAAIMIIDPLKPSSPKSGFANRQPSPAPTSPSSVPVTLLSSALLLHNQPLTTPESIVTTILNSSSQHNDHHLSNSTTNSRALLQKIKDDERALAGAGASKRKDDAQWTALKPYSDALEKVILEESGRGVSIAWSTTTELVKKRNLRFESATSNELRQAGESWKRAQEKAMNLVGRCPHLTGVTNVLADTMKKKIDVSSLLPPTKQNSKKKKHSTTHNNNNSDSPSPQHQHEQQQQQQKEIESFVLLVVRHVTTAFRALPQSFEDCVVAASNAGNAASTLLKQQKEEELLERQQRLKQQQQQGNTNNNGGEAATTSSNPLPKPSKSSSTLNSLAAVARAAVAAAAAAAAANSGMNNNSSNNNANSNNGSRHNSTISNNSSSNPSRNNSILPSSDSAAEKGNSASNKLAALLKRADIRENLRKIVENGNAAKEQSSTDKNGGKVLESDSSSNKAKKDAAKAAAAKVAAAATTGTSGGSSTSVAATARKGSLLHFINHKGFPFSFLKAQEELLSGPLNIPTTAATTSTSSTSAVAAVSLVSKTSTASVIDKLQESLFTEFFIKGSDFSITDSKCKANVVEWANKRRNPYLAKTLIGRILRLHSLLLTDACYTFDLLTLNAIAAATSASGHLFHHHHHPLLSSPHKNNNNSVVSATSSGSGPNESFNLQDQNLLFSTTNSNTATNATTNNNKDNSFTSLAMLSSSSNNNINNQQQPSAQSLASSLTILTVANILTNVKERLHNSLERHIREATAQILFGVCAVFWEGTIVRWCNRYVQSTEEGANHFEEQQDSSTFEMDGSMRNDNDDEDGNNNADTQQSQGLLASTMILPSLSPLSLEILDGDKLDVGFAVEDGAYDELMQLCRETVAQCISDAL